MENKRKEHWQNVYETKDPHQVGWTQKVPQTSLDIFKDLQIEKTASIIDVGAGDSRLVDHLLELGYYNITVLDISGKAIEKAKFRLGKKADMVKWVVTDIVEFIPDLTYDVWHDRACFHFLTEKKDVSIYLNLVSQFVNQHLVIGAFSDEGPTHCSGLEIVQYNAESLSNLFQISFNAIDFKKEDHITPSGSLQNFIFGRFRKK